MSHISPQTEQTEQTEQSRSLKLSEQGEQSPRFDAWVTGSLFSANRNGMSNVEWPISRGKRDKVGPFNKSSRLRALRALAMTEQKAQSYLGTATYSDVYAETVCLSYAGANGSGKKVKRDLDTFSKRLKRNYPGVGAFWRVETIDRKSGEFVGEIFPHIHPIFWGIEDLNEFRQWFAWAWADIVAEEQAIDSKHLKAGTAIQPAWDWRGLMKYASKEIYAVKRGDSKLGNMGRWWGLFNREAIPWSPVQSNSLSDKCAIMLIRSMRKYLERKINNPWLKHAKSLTIFTDDPTEWVRLSNYYQQEIPC